MTPAAPDELDQRTTESALAEYLAKAASQPAERDALVRLLDERHPLFAGRTANEVARIRGRILATFERTGLPDAAIVFVAEELQTGMHAYSVGAAARAVRGLAQPRAELTPFLLKAIENIAPADDLFSFDDAPGQWPPSRPTTALAEIFETLQWMGGAARAGLPFIDELLEGALHRFPAGLAPRIQAARESMAAGPAPRECGCFMAADVAPTSPSADVASVEMQDQDGQTLAFRDFFAGMPAVLAFFYTRCDNPQKCSLTIARLAELQQLIRRRGLDQQIRVAAITYDPEFDLPQRLRAYGEVRGFRFDANNRILRITDAFAIVQRFFQLGINFTGTIVNRHRLEVFVLDGNGAIAHAHSRLQWQAGDLMDVVSQACQRPVC